jgi:hypothetical protein
MEDGRDATLTLTPRELAELTELVYRLLRADLLRARERAGPSAWRR